MVVARRVVCCRPVVVLDFSIDRAGDFRAKDVSLPGLTLTGRPLIFQDGKSFMAVSAPVVPAGWPARVPGCAGAGSGVGRAIALRPSPALQPLPGSQARAQTMKSVGSA